MSDPVPLSAAMAEVIAGLVVGGCSCPDAQRWARYWATEAVAARLAEELDTHRWIRRDRERDACNDMRGPRRVGDYQPIWHLPSHAEMHRRRYG